MANDFDIAALAKRWQQQPILPEAVPDTTDLIQASQRQRRQKCLLYIEWLGAALMVATAVWLVLTLPDWLGYVSAAFLGLGALSAAYISWQIHQPIVAYDNWSSDGLLQFHCRICQLSLRYYRYSQLSCAVMLLFTLVLWLLREWRLAKITSDLLQVYSFLVSPLCLLAIFGLQKKVRQKSAELQRLNALADGFK